MEFLQNCWSALEDPNWNSSISKNDLIVTELSVLVSSLAVGNGNKVLNNLQLRRWDFIKNCINKIRHSGS